MSVSLAEFMAEAIDPGEDEESRARYRIGDRGNPLGEADWAARKMRQFQAKIAERVAEAEAEKARVDEWLAAEIGRYQPDVDYFRGLLVRFWQSEMAMALDDAGDEWDKVDRKSQALPCGVVLTASKTPPAMKVEDFEAFKAWAQRAHPELIDWKPTAKVADAKKLLKAAAGGQDPVDRWSTRANALDPKTGEVVPGVVITSRIDFGGTTVQ